MWPQSRTGRLVVAALAVVVLVLVVRARVKPGDGEGGAAAAAAAEDLSITEGTNMAVTMSPDGQTLVTDLLGNLWTVAAGGGQAKRITDVLFEARQPDF